MKKRILIAAVAIISLAAAAAAGFLLMRQGVFAPPIRGELRVLSFAPQGEQIPVDADGIAVTFSRPVVALSSLDEGRGKAVALTIQPAIKGRFSWLGTSGFIFRPEEPLAPATKYRVEMPAGLTSSEGYRLESPLAWEFTTVRPRVTGWAPSPDQVLLPKSAVISIRFNVAMKQADVESRLALLDAESGAPLQVKPRFEWRDDGHVLRVTFGDSLPWNRKLRVSLPAGVLPAAGEIGTAEETTASYTTPEKEVALEKVVAIEPDYDGEGERDKLLPAGKRAKVKATSGICFVFTQPIEKKSFERAFHVEAPTDGGKGQAKPQPYFFFEEREAFPAYDDARHPEIEGYRRGCVAVLDDYNRAYDLSIDPAKVLSLSGAPLSAGTTRYQVQTSRADPELRSLITRNILSSRGVLKIPYRAINLSALTVNLYRLPDSSFYSESVRDDRIQEPEEGSEPPSFQTFAGSRLSVPVDAQTLTIDRGRMAPVASLPLPLDLPADRSERVVVDLGVLDPAPSPGYYLLEAIGTPAAKAPEGKAWKRATYAMVQLSPVGLALKRDVDRMLVWATEIESGAPAAGLAVNARLMKWKEGGERPEPVAEASATTGPDGVAIVNLPSDDQARACAEVTTPGSEAFVCEEMHDISDYRNVLQRRQNHFASLFTDRPIYRPGQRVFFSAFVREVREGRYFLPKADARVSVTATDASGKQIFAMEKAALEPGGVIGGAFDLSGAEDAPRGDYALTVAVGEQRFTRSFSVTSYRKPSFKADVALRQEEIVSRGELDALIKGSYFFGAPLAKAPVHWSIMTTTYDFEPEGYDGFSFLDPDLLMRRPANGDDEGESEFASEYEYAIVSSYIPETSEAEGQFDDPRGDGSFGPMGMLFRDPEKKDTARVPAALNDAGELAISYRPNLKKYPTSQRLTVEASITDPARQEVSASADAIVHKADFYLGLKPERYTVGAKEEAVIDAVALKTDGKPLAGKSFSVEVLRREYASIERRNSAGNWELVFEPSDQKLTTISAKSDDKGRAAIRFQVPQGGQYRFVASAEDGADNRAQSAVDLFAWGEGYVPWRLDEPEKIELVPDKAAYRVGETAKVLVKSLLPASRALFTLERGRMLEQRVVELGGNATHVEIPITEGMIPNFTLSLIAHAPRAGERPPMLFHGETALMVEPERKRLNLALTPDRRGEGDEPPVYRPGDEVSVKLVATGPDGKPQQAHVIVSVADESVLRLMNFKLPDLVKKFYYRRPDSVISADSLLSLKAGDAGSTAGKKRRDFRDTAFFEKNLTTDEQGVASFRFRLPDDTTTWSIQALGITESKGIEAYEAELAKASAAAPAGQRSLGFNLALSDGTLVGSSRTSIMATLPVVLRAALPRFAAWGDRITARIIATNRTDKPVEGKLALTVAGDGALSGDKAGMSEKLKVPAKGEQVVPLEIEAKSVSDGGIRLSAAATAKGGEELDAIENAIPVKDRFAPETVATSGMTTDQAIERVAIPKEAVRDRGGLNVAFRASIAMAASPSLRALIDFPWACSEQKSASLIALTIASEMTARFGEAYFDNLAPLPATAVKDAGGLKAKEELLARKISSLASELVRSFQHYDGGMRYWPEATRSEFLPSAQSLLALTRAKAAGAAVPAEALARLRTFVRDRIATDPKRLDRAISWDDRALGLWALSTAGGQEPEIAKAIAAHLDDLTIGGQAYLLMAGKAAGVPDVTAVRDRLMAQARREPRAISWPASSFFWSSAGKNTALAGLSLLSLDPADPDVRLAIASLLDRRRSDAIVSTQEELYSSLLLSEYAKRSNEDAADFTARLLVDQVDRVKKDFDRDNISSTQGELLPLKALGDAGSEHELTIAKQGEGTLYYDLLLTTYFPPEKAPAREEGIIISRDYFALGDREERKPLTRFVAGENYRGRVIVIAPQELNYVLVQELLPAGFEPIDLSLATSSRASWLLSQQGGDGGPPPFELESLESYDDVVTPRDYGGSDAFDHQEVRDDALVFSARRLPAGIHEIRYPVRATTAGEYLMPGAVAFEFYRPEVFGRSRPRQIEISGK